MLVLVEVPYCANMHELELKLPSTPPSLHDTVPVGIVFVLEFESRTLACSAIVVPITIAPGFGERVVLVGSKIIAFATNIERVDAETRNATNIDRIRILLISNPTQRIKVMDVEFKVICRFPSFESA